MEVDIENAKKCLLQIQILDKHIQDKLFELSELKTIACGASVCDNNERVQVSGDKDRLGIIISKIVDLEKEINMAVDKFVDLKFESMETINAINEERYRAILVKKYFEYKSIYEIAGELNMSVRGCRKAHKRALEEFNFKNKKHNI